VAVFADNALFAFMRIIFGVTIVTGGLELNIENGLDVAIDTLNRFVRPYELVFGIHVMFEKGCRPELGAVAGVTLIAKVLLVIVILEVT